MTKVRRGKDAGGYMPFNIVLQAATSITDMVNILRKNILYVLHCLDVYFSQ